MAIVISGVNNNDKITASDGTIDLLSGVNFVSEVTVPSFKIGSGIQLGNAGIATATTFVGNLTGNVNATSNLLLQIGGSEKFRVASSGQLGIGGANYGTSGQVLTSGGSGSAATWSTITGTTINNNAANRIITGEGGTTLNGEANLTYDGSTLGLAGSLAMTGGSISLDSHSLIATAGFTDISGGSYAARLGSTGSSTIRSTQIYGGGNHLATFDGVNYRLGINVTAPTAKIDINSAGHYVATNSGKAVTGIHVRGQAGNSGELGGGISFACNNTGASAIAAEQMSSNSNVTGLAFFTHPTSTASDDASKKMKINNNGGIILNNWESNRGFIFQRLDSGGASYPDFANVQGSQGRGIIDAQKTINQNTTTDLCRSHWGGLALVGYSGTGHQGIRQVMFGYGGAGASVRFSGNWVGSLTTTFSVSAYTLRVNHNASNALDFWVILIGI